MKKSISAIIMVILVLTSCMTGLVYAEEYLPADESSYAAESIGDEAPASDLPENDSEETILHRLQDPEKDFLFTSEDHIILFKNVFEAEEEERSEERRQFTRIKFLDRSSLSAFLKEVGWMYIYVEGKGEKVNRIEIVQQDQLLVRTYNVESYSSVGHYVLLDFEFLQPFRVPDGKNEVTVKFYDNNTLVAALPYTFISVAHPTITAVFSNMKYDNLYSLTTTRKKRYVGLDAKQLKINVQILGIQKEDSIEVDLVDENGRKVGEIFQEEPNEYKAVDGSISKKVRINLYPDILQQGMILVPQAKINGEIIRGTEDDNTVLKVVTSPKIVSIPQYTKKPDSIKIGIVNADRFQNIYIDFWQNEQLVGSTTDYQIKWDEKELVSYLDIPLRDHYLQNPNGEFKIKIRNSQKVLFEQTLLPALDNTENNADNWLKEDGLNPKATVMPTLHNQPVDKIFRVLFNTPIDVSSVTKDNLYVIDKESGKRIDIDLSRLKLDSVEGEAVTEYELTAAIQDEYRPNQLYILVLEPGIRGLNGAELTKQVVLYFTIR